MQLGRLENWDDEGEVGIKDSSVDSLQMAAQIVY